jgi:hypothetical protein
MGQDIGSAVLGRHAGSLPGQAERLDQPQHAALAVGDAEAFLGDPARVDDPSRRHAADSPLIRFTVQPMYALAAPKPAIQPFAASATNPGPRFEQMWAGTPRGEQVPQGVDHVWRQDPPHRSDGQRLARNPSSTHDIRYRHPSPVASPTKS